MKKVLLLGCAAVMLFCSACGSSQKWVYYEKEMDMEDEDWVSNYHCKNILSKKQCREITKKIRKKYDNIKINITKEKASGLLKKDIELEKDDYNTYIGGMFTDEFDKLFDVDDYTLDTYVNVLYITGSSKEIEHIEFEIYAFYDSSKKEIRNYFENNDYSKEMNYAFCELDYVKEE